MFDNDKPYTLDSVVRMVLGAGFFIGMVWLLGYLSGVLVPFVAALLVAYLLNPLTCSLEKRVGNRGVAVLLTMLLLVVVSAAVILLVVPMMVNEFAHMGQVLSRLVSNTELADKVAAHLPPDIWAWVRETVQTPEVQELFTAQGALNAAKAVAGNVVPGIRGVAVGAINAVAGIFGVFVILLYVIFLLADFGRIKAGWQDYLPARYRESVTGFLGEFEKTMGLYFRGQIIVCLIVGVLMSIGFLLIGLPLGLVMGMLIGILNIAPYLGVAGVIPVLFLAGLDSLEAGESVWVGIGLAMAVMAVVQVIQDAVLVPKIQGESLGLSPWLILLSLSIWGRLLGFLGLLIALPMTCLCLSYYRRLLAVKAVETASRPSSETE
ncbi:AI-2E family transporter [Pseudodesulfovibrio thermohalotolerans]|uniref:AI-2E family transporter n=1 Tax=Pseudodesulfovibrio thermohalotolerans TaxID=2880651 RepID=UPI002441ABB0|nr:AI-2E family transporter [Pseudodesulfovibrio thermohalotolerans]WFS62245.1 AI-2E family transporter [Pseudodesulfovibrio thermohalotolerans]